MVEVAPAPSWRSLLFAPADRPEIVGKARRSGSDAVIVDLEDAVPPASKDFARKALAELGGQFEGGDPPLLVRINNEPDLLEADIAALPANVIAIVLPKTSSHHEVAKINRELGARALENGGGVGIIAIVEDPAAILEMAHIARAPGVIGLALGTEDFAVSMRVPPTPDLLRPPANMLCLAAAAAGCMALAIPTSIAAFRDLDAWRAGAEYGRAVGATGGLCIHPAQVAILNEIFAPTASELDWARAVMEEWERAAGAGVATYKGQMIDLPVLKRAQGLLGLVKAG